MMIPIVLVLFILLFFLPFLPGIVELVRKEDADPLYIAMNYIKDPRYFGKSFKQLLNRATDGFTAGPGFRDIQLSKKEGLQITRSLDIPEAQVIDYLLCVQGDLISSGKVQFNKETYVTGNASVGPNNVIHVLEVEGNVAIAVDVKLQRWLDADGDVDIGANGHLGISASSGKKLHLAKNCTFRRLYGIPITTGEHKVISIHQTKPLLPPAESLPQLPSFVRIKDHTIPPGTIVAKNVVFSRDVQIGYGSVFSGAIKAYGKVVLEDDVTINGNVIADGDIIIGRRAHISGHVFSQKTIHISSETVISTPDTVKSVVGKKSVRIEEGVTIFGYVTTEGEGMII